MPVRIEYEPMEKVGGCFYLREGAKNQFQHRTALFRCGACEKTFECSINAVKSGNTKSCGCQRWREKHGLHTHPVYKKWAAIKSRCTCENDQSYHHYGGRGIKMHSQWKDDFKSFYDYVSALPHFGEEGYSIDREDNDGDYEPDNVRWATRHVQNANKRSLSNQTGYVGVRPNCKRYTVRIFHDGKEHHVGSFKTIKEGVEARNNYIIENELWEYPIQKWKG